jgi:hypothetical protein
MPARPPKAAAGSIKLHSYTYPVKDLRLGGSYGNHEAFARLDAKTDLDGFWTVDNHFYCGRLELGFSADGHQLTPERTTFSAASQRTLYRGAGVEVQKIFFVPMGTDYLRAACFLVDAVNTGKSAVTLRVHVFVRFPAAAPEEFTSKPAAPEQEQTLNMRLSEDVFVAQSSGMYHKRLAARENEVRLFGNSTRPSEYRFITPGILRATYEYRMAAGQRRLLTYPLLVSDRGEEHVRRFLPDMLHHGPTLLKGAEQAYQNYLRLALVFTPDGLINRGIEWAKVNTLRVQHHFPNGSGFTNDPPQDIMVVRDAAWFTYGSDYFTPYFSREMLEVIARDGIEPGGKLTEYINCSTYPPTKDDYELNINDDTPLFVLACAHHYLTSLDGEFLDRLYPVCRQAMEYTLLQKRRDLIFCDARGTNVWGIASWRNVITSYTLNGAVTEINSECVAALRALATLAAARGLEEDNARYSEEADALACAINAQLVSSETGLYLLNRDVEGVEHHDVTGDQCFPVMFDVADAEMSERVLDRLHGREFWTKFGVRTVGTDQESYDPDYGSQLLGGIWPNLTAWVAMAGKVTHPDRLAEAMRNIYRVSEARVPKRLVNLCPGEFPERLHGEEITVLGSKGMAMSPWMPPTYLWMAVEGLCGVQPTLAGPRIEPHLHPRWGWIGAREVPYSGSPLTFFVWQGRLYVNRPVQSTLPVELFEQDVSYLVRSNTFHIALRRRGEVVIFFATDEDCLVEASLDQRFAGVEREYRLRLRRGQAHLIVERSAGASESS